MRIVIPSLPPVEFSPNSRVHYLKRYEAGLVAKDAIIALVREQGWSGTPLVNPTVRITWGLPTKVQIDWDNLISRCKPWVDGLVAAGVLVNDSVRDYRPVYDWFESPRKPMTVIEVIL